MSVNGNIITINKGDKKGVQRVKEAKILAPHLKHSIYFSKIT